MATVAISPKGAYFAKSCPQRVQLDVLQPCEPLPDSPFLQKLFRAGDEHEDETIGGVFDEVEGAVVIEADDPDAREWHTRQAIAQGARLVAGGGCRSTSTRIESASPTCWWSAARGTCRST